jgi:hypothetical protein
MRIGNKNNKELERIFDELAESVLSLSNTEILDEVIAEGLDPCEESDRIDALLRRASKGARQHKLLAAKEEYNRQLATMEKKEYGIPQEPEKRRKILMATLARRPDVRSAVTAQFRDFADLSDEDIVTALKQLAELDLLNKCAQPCLSNTDPHRSSLPSWVFQNPTTLMSKRSRNTVGRRLCITHSMAAKQE